MLIAQVADCRRRTGVSKGHGVADLGDPKLVGNGRSLEVAVFLFGRSTHDGARGAPLLRTSLFSATGADHGHEDCCYRPSLSVMRKVNVLRYLSHT